MIRLAQAADRVQPTLVFVGRILFGVLLSAVLSMIGIGIGWGMFVFFGAVSQTTLLILFMSGGGIGAALGSVGVLLRIDSVPALPQLFGIGLVLVLAGIGGAYGGFQYGAAQEIECCVGPAITPITYTALGATTGANLAAIAMAVGQGVRRAGRVTSRSGLDSPPASSAGDARPTAH